jgi:hypothetical protein
MLSSDLPKMALRKKLISSIPLMVGGAHIFPVVRNLGVMLLDSQLLMGVQINSTFKKSLLPSQANC